MEAVFPWTWLLPGRLRLDTWALVANLIVLVFGTTLKRRFLCLVRVTTDRFLGAELVRESSVVVWITLLRLTFGSVRNLDVRWPLHATALAPLSSSVAMLLVVLTVWFDAVSMPCRIRWLTLVTLTVSSSVLTAAGTR